MIKIIPEVYDYYDRELTILISEKYGYSQMEALQLFLSSEVRRMMEDPELEMIEFSALAIFDMWEAEKVTGNPRNSIYIRGE